MLEFLKRKQIVTGESKRGELFNVRISRKEEISEDAFIELTDGGGDDDR